MRMRQRTSALVKMIVVLCLSVTMVHGQDLNWRDDFDETCTQSNQAMAFSVDQLKSLIARCDKLKKVIETQDETVAKVYLKRLQMCRNLYQFVLENKQREQGQVASGQP